MNRPEYQSVGKSVRKKDSLQLLLGKPVYTDDIAPDALVVKLLRSPHANAIVETIDVSKAKKLPGVVDVYTWEDVPNERFSNAGQTYPETSPYDRLIIDRHVRFVGDVVAIVAAETEEAAEKALGRIKVTYNVLEPVLSSGCTNTGLSLAARKSNTCSSTLYVTLMRPRKRRPVALRATKWKSLCVWAPTTMGAFALWLLTRFLIQVRMANMAGPRLA